MFELFDKLQTQNGQILTENKYPIPWSIHSSQAREKPSQWWKYVYRKETKKKLDNVCEPSVNMQPQSVINDTNVGMAREDTIKKIYL